MQNRIFTLLLFVLAATRTAQAADTLEAVLKDLAHAEQEAKRLKPDDRPAIQALTQKASALSLRLVGLKDRKNPQVKAAHVRTLELRQKLSKLAQPSDVVSAPKSSVAARKFPLSSQGPTSRDEATVRRLDAMLERYKTPPRELNAGRILGFTKQHAAALRAETERFTRDHGAAVGRWKADLSDVRSMPSTQHSEGRRWFVNSELESRVPWSFNQQVRLSRMYLEAAVHDALRHTKEKLGLTPKVIYVGPGRSMIGWESGATPEDSLRFAYQTVEIGAFFERQLGGDPKPWLERKQEIETLAQENGIRLDVWN